MKKGLLLLVIGCFMTAFPAAASMNFYRTASVHIVIEAEDCSDAAHLVNFTQIPDDPPGGTNNNSDEEDVTDPTTQNPTGVNTQYVNGGINTLTDAFTADPGAPVRDRFTGDISGEVENLLDAATFDDRQESLITFVRDVNWKTGIILRGVITTFLGV